MASLFQNRKLLIAGLVGFFIFIFVLVLTIQDRNSQKFATPDLIQLAFAKGEITNEERLLYLAYALGDSEKLPLQYYGKTPWSGTMIGLELYETVKSKEAICKLSPYTRDELQRVLKINGAVCD